MQSELKIHLIGNAHLDPVWLWRWQEGLAEIKATFRSALDRMMEFPEFTFTCSSASYYQWVEENAPEMFEEIRERIKEGRWIIAGGWWLQSDCNIPAGESFVRHGLYGQRYFFEKFGAMAKTGYNVDSFGHNGMLPQILLKSGMHNYVFMRPGKEEKDLPGNLFWWESEDGSRVMTFRIPFDYGMGWGDPNSTDPTEKQKLIATRKLAEELGYDLMGFYGVGNHGGGPTIANLTMIRQMQREWGNGCLLMNSPDAYFEEMRQKVKNLPVVKDDLQHHASGAYSAHSEIKCSNRRAEHRLLTAEKFCSITQHMLGLPYPHTRINKAWQNVLFNQFHDIITGCSIKEAYQDARESYGEALNIGAEALNGALQKISWSINTMGTEMLSLSKEKDWVLWEQDNMGIPLVVFNPLSWEVRIPVQVNKLLKGITDETGQALQIQVVRGSRTNLDDKWDTLFIGNIPAMGYRVYRIFKDKELPIQSKQPALIADDTSLENDFIRLELDKTGVIRRLYDKRIHAEALAGEGALPVVIDEHDCDTWAHFIFEFRKEVGRFGNADIRLIEHGPVRGRLRVTSRYASSTLQQDFIIYNDRPEVEVMATVDWREKHKMLKLSFPVNVQNPRAVYEIPYGYIVRPVNGEEEPGQQWLDVSGTHGDAQFDYGLALLNDCKYSFDVKGNDLRMTVVRSPIFADHYGLRDEYCEFMDQGMHEFRYVLLPHTGSWREAGIVKKAYELNVPPIQIVETYHKGILPQKMGTVSISEDNIIATALKWAEDENGYILRCYETCGRATRAKIRSAFLNREWSAYFGRCEIKTFRIPADPQEEVVENNLLELPADPK
jgi:alpha-mannosidase